MFGFGKYNKEDLTLAVKQGDLDLVKKITDKNPSLIKAELSWYDQESYYDGYALHCAAWFNQPEIIQYLVKEQGMKINLQDDSKERTALHFSAINSSHRAMKILVELGASATVKDAYYNMPLKYCSNDDEREMISPGYIQKQAENREQEHLQREKEKMKSNFYDAVKSGDVESLKKILSQNSSMLTETFSWDNGSGYAVHCAAWFNQPDVIELFVKEYGADINCQQGVKSSFTALHHASVNNSLEAAQKLIDLGADKLLKESYSNQTAFERAKKNSMREILEPGYMASKQIKEDFQTSIRNGDIAALKNILDKNPEFLEEKIKWVQSGDNYEGSALHMAAFYNQPQIIEFLVKENAMDVNLQENTPSKWTPLHHAVNRKAYEAALKLMNLGANASLQNNNGRTSDYYRSGDGMREVIDLQYRARVEEERVNKRKGVWKKYGPEEIVHIHEVEGFRITDVFNFKARSWKSMTKDINNGQVSQETIFFDNVPDKAVLYEALSKHNEDFGGGVDKAVIESRGMRGKQPRL